jgi:hypothetical protein
MAEKALSKPLKFAVRGSAKLLAAKAVGWALTKANVGSAALTFADAAPLNVGEDKEVRERKARWRREMSTKPDLMMN